MAGASVNKVIIIGNLGKDPELRYTQNGQAIAKFPMATTESWGQGEDRREHTEWHNIVVWGRQAENCGQYLSKGRRVFVEGRIQSRKYNDNEGNTRYITEIVALNVVFLDPKNPQQSQSGGYGGPQGGGGGGGYDRPNQDSAPQSGPDSIPDDDDIPF